MSKKLLPFLLIAFAYCASGLSSQINAADKHPDYLKQIKPILRKGCYSCHGSLKQEGDLRLDTVTLMIKGGAITRGKVDESPLLERVSAKDIDERMPPEHEGEPFSAEQISLIRSWIKEGALAPEDEKPESDPKDHWAFKPIIRPSVEKLAWGTNAIDSFIAKKHKEHGLVPQAEASRLILIRRLYIDLIGMPPSPEEISEFENDQTSGAYGKIVKRLLDDPRYGERWGRHWMDIWRYSDWWGLGQQLRKSQKHIWHWRDWIVESLNDNMPYDEMVRLMLAADELYPNDSNKIRATGYLARNYFLFNRPQWMEETVEHVSKGFLGLTMNCAKCHDHKYDPIKHSDFYKLRAFFEPYHVRLDLVPGELDFKKDGIPRIFDGLPDTPTYRYVRGDEKNPDKSTLIKPGFPEFLAFKELNIKPVSLPVESWQPERRPGILELYEKNAGDKVEAAEKKLLKALQKLIAARKQKLEAVDQTKPKPVTKPKTETIAKTKTEAVTKKKPETAKPETAKPVAKQDPLQEAIDKAQQELIVAEYELDLARVEQDSVKKRVVALRAKWSGAKQKSERKKIEAAIRAEREVTLAISRIALAKVELKLLTAKGKKDKIQKELKKAEDELKKSEKNIAAPIGKDDSFTTLAGARWTPTRFFNSTKDDPTVKFPKQSTGRRTELAKWITDRRNPLTARVAVNHIWTRHMGKPFVPSIFDFGRNGDSPTHPELLDWLASELIESGWNMKHLHQLIVNSSVYRMGSSVAQRSSNLSKDSENKYWWRRVPIRIESQVVRDSILTQAGTLDLTMGGPPVIPNKQATSKRRGLYFFHSNNARNLFLTTFDEALVKSCYRRDQSIVPQQALALSNSKLVLDSKKQIAERLSKGTASDLEFIQKSFTVMLGIKANQQEIDSSLKAMKEWRKIPDSTENDARAHFIWVLINHNDFVTLR